ncbi:glycoside hydrolase family 79 protein [Panus rudis PR-1116 ss-1]|nr:glycoside hydrolase family 79 protein [Panus rudis PR-1116 ss-1]
MAAFPTLLLTILGSLAVARAVTVYSQQPIRATAAATATATDSPDAQYTGLAAYNPKTLAPPPLPDPKPATQFGIQLQPAAAAVPGLSIPASGALFGFSIETSVINQFLGTNSSFIQVPFLNLVSTVIQRTGRFNIRIGGNTQETARLVDQTIDGRMIEKQSIDPNNPTATPILVYTMEMFYLMSNISSLLNVNWYLGVPLNDTSQLHLDIAHFGETLLGDRLLGLQVGNEPDLYAQHQKRPEGYSPADYVNEVQMVLDAMRSAGPGEFPVTNNFIGPSVSTSGWTPEMVFDAGFVDRFKDTLHALSVENYPDNNCAAIYAPSSADLRDPQTVFPGYLTHTGDHSGYHMLQKFLNASSIAQANGLPMLMFETNTASCGGFPGVSNSFGAALWGVDYGLQLAWSNFTGAMLHCGGQNVFYNPATPPPTGDSTFHQWTVGPLMYSILAVAETLGASNNSRVLDLGEGINGGDGHTPGYAVYEGDTLSRVALLNYMDDPTGASDLTIAISVGGGETGAPASVPASVRVKYLRAPSVVDHFNITWAGQTFGGQFGSDGRLQGDEQIETISCDQAANVCNIKVPAPSFALVFFTDEALKESEPSATVTFGTTAYTKTINTATVDPQVLATSNGHGGKNRPFGSTSKGSTGAASVGVVVPSLMSLGAVLLGVGVFVRRW